MGSLQIKRLAGPDIQPYIFDLAALRIKIFHDYPYLYQGNLEYEKKYLKTYLDCPNSVLVLVFDDDKIVGASTAIPLKNETEQAKAPFLSTNLDINKIFFLGESLLLHDYRGQKMGHRFFSEREAAAREQGYSMTAFWAVERPSNHPKKPNDWIPLDTFWGKLGYVKHPEIKGFIDWKEIGEDEETPKPMMFWLKQL